MHRTTRRVVVTEQGERVVHRAQRILDDLDLMVEELGITRRAPRGTLRICSSFGFGRQIVAPALSELTSKYPSLQVRFEVFDRLVDITSEGFDLDVRVGDEIPPHFIARKLASNHRILCAAPSYLKRHGSPRTLSDLSSRSCLIIKERDHPFGVWHLRSEYDQQTVKVSGPLSSNNGEIVLQWAIEGQGIILRSMWNVRPLLKAGKLVQVIPDYRQDASVWAVYPSRLDSSAKVRVCVEWLQRAFQNLNEA